MNLTDELLADVTTNPLTWWKAGKNARRAVAPRPEFLSPLQSASYQLQPGDSWWVVPVTVRRPARFGSGLIPRCTVSIKVMEAEDVLIERNMRWLTSDESGNSARVDLEAGRLEHIPIATRVEAREAQLDGAAVLSDVNAFVYKAGKVLIAPGRYDIVIEIQSGQRRWTEAVSGIRYELIVPPTGVSNGQFLLHSHKLMDE